MSWQKKRRSLCVSSWAATGPTFFTMEDCEKSASPQSAFDVCAPGDREVHRDSSAASSSNDWMSITGRPYLAATRTCSDARVGVPSDARLLSAVTRKTLRGPQGLEWRPLFLSSLLVAGRESTCLERFGALTEESVAKLLKTAAPSGSLECRDSVSPWRCAESAVCSLKPSSFLARRRVDDTTGLDSKTMVCGWGRCSRGCSASSRRTSRQFTQSNGCLSFLLRKSAERSK